MRSIEHRANILSKKSNSLGVAVIKVVDGYYAVQDFAFSAAADDPDTAEQRMITVFTRVRKEADKTPGQFTPDTQLRAYACAMANNDDVAVKGLPMPKGFQHMLGYAISEPDELPDPLQAIASDPSIVSLELGACYKATRKYPGGGYWFIIVY